jgi:hypothetical protein
MFVIHDRHSGLQTHDAPGTFSALMDLYERNYISMRRLLPVMPPVPAVRVSRVQGGLDLHLRIVERRRYTSELILTYEFGHKEGALIAEPNLRIRVYHDARMVEVMAARPRYHAAFAADFLSGDRPDRTQLHARWRINRFLYKWLSYCLWQGHRFTEPASRRA